MKVVSGKDHDSLFGLNGGDKSGGSSSSRSSRTEYLGVMNDDLMIELMGELSKEVGGLKATVGKLEATLTQHLDEIASLKSNGTMSYGFVEWGGAVMGAAAGKGINVMAAIFGVVGDQEDFAAMDDDASARGYDSEDEVDVVFENEIDDYFSDGEEEATPTKGEEFAWENDNDGAAFALEAEESHDDESHDDNEEKTDLAAGGGMTHSATKGKKTKKKKGRKRQRKKNRKKGTNCGIKVEVSSEGRGADLIVSRAAAGTVMPWVTGASEQLPILWKSFRQLEKWIAMGFSFLLFFGVIGQGHGSGGSSSVVPSQSKTSHFSSPLKEDGEVPSTSSTNVQKPERIAPVLALEPMPVPAIIKEVPAALFDDHNENVVNSFAIDQTHQTFEARTVVPKDPLAATTFRNAPATTSNLRTSSASQNAKRVDATPRKLQFPGFGGGGGGFLNPSPSESTSSGPTNIPSKTPARTTSEPSDSLITTDPTPDPTYEPTVEPTTIDPTFDPTSPIRPSTSPAPTSACKESNPEECGCTSMNQVDYIGSISITKSGAMCAERDGSNFCRNPTDDEGGAWCWIEEGGWEYCDVPTCEDSLTTATPSISIFPSTSHGPSVSPTDTPSSTPTTSHEPTTTPSSYCDSASGIGDACENGDAGGCDEFINDCCGEDEACKCENKKKVCDHANKAGSGAGKCMEAETVCAGDDKVKICNFWEPICAEYPKSKIDNGAFSTCDWAASHCCSRDNYHCKCDFLSHLEELNEDDEVKKDENCDAADLLQPALDVELEAIQGIYNATQGDHWLDNTGWSTSTGHCDWYGILCNDDGFVIQINLKSNNVTGEIPSDFLSKLYKLKTLDLSDNYLYGTMAGTFDDGWDGIINDTSVFFNLRELIQLDVSQNNLIGEVDVLFAPALEHVNFSHNNFTSINSFKSFKLSHKTLKICDLSFNLFQEEAINLMKNLPPILEQLVLSNNLFQGPLPKSLESLDYLRRFRIDSNNLSGELTDFATPFPNLQELNLSNQKRDDNIGFTGTIPESLSNLPFLTTLNLANNDLASTIPPVLGNLAQLKVLDLSNNLLTSGIPRELGKLGGTLEIFHLSANKLTGSILPELISLEGASIQLRGNDIEIPAPLTFCSSSEFDLWQNQSLCPKDRNALKAVYESTKGGEWTDNNNWLAEYDYCHWLGVTCNEADKITIIKLVLPNNGLSGKLTKSIANLSALEVLDLSDNDIKGEIPTEIGLLSELEHLRLNHNSLVGGNTTFGNLMRPQLIQLHGNRLSGSIQLLNLEFPNSSSYISDCGSPSDYDESLICEECTMCCNAAGDCYPQEENYVQRVGFVNYMQFTGFFFACIIGSCCILALLLFAFDKHKNRNDSIFATNQASQAARDKTYALHTMGIRSVYQFFISSSLLGWTIVLGTLAAQVGMLFIFVSGSEVDLTDDNVDLSYTYKCPRDQAFCTNTTDLNWQGWIVFVILMMAHLLKDIINGVKMIILSAKERHDHHSRARYFVAGTLLLTVTAFTLYVSTIYSAAIATSNTDIIINSVVILFITDVDEFFHDILMVISPGWVKKITFGEENSDNNVANGDGQGRRNETGHVKKDDDEEIILLRENFEKLEKSNLLAQQLTQTNIEKLLEQNSLLRDMLARGQNLPQEEAADDENV